jgi:Arc/MetJ-type ribon-helix-helix transcriptional regulator
MVLDLDLATEQRIQRQLDGRSYSAPADVIKRALDLLEADEQDLIARRASIVARLQESHAQAERGETFSPEEVRARLARQREEHPEFSVARR